MSNFRGASSLTIDAKGRIVLPVRYRERFAELSNGQVVVTIDADQPCLLIYSLGEWEVVQQKLDSLPSYNKVVKQLQRKMIGYATDLEINDSGRIQLTPPLRGYAHLDKKLMMIGQGNKFELWDEALWEQQCHAEVDDEIPDALKEMSF